jgi:hypothetical protein
MKMNLRTLAVFVAIIATIGVVTSLSMISTYAPVDAASCRQHHHQTGNDDCQGNDNNSGNQDTGGNENGDN